MAEGRLWVGCGNWGFLSATVDANVILSGKCRPKTTIQRNTYEASKIQILIALWGSMKKLFLLLIVLICQSTNAEDNAVSYLFAALGIEGTIVIKSLRTGQTFVHNDARASQRFAPASSFKIFNTLIALEENVVSAKGNEFKWDGKLHDLPDWNRDQTLESAFKVSCVWCYQEIANKVGEKAYRRYIGQANYGVLTDKFDLTNFWLDGSLQISAYEQVDFVRKVYQQELPFKAQTFSTLKKMMLAEEQANYKLYAKTGWAARMKPQVGWYVGYVEVTDDVWFFAINIEPRTDADLALRQKLTKEALQVKHIIP